MSNGISSKENTLHDTTANAVTPPSTMEVTKIRTARSSALKREAGLSLANELKRAQSQQKSDFYPSSGLSIIRGEEGTNSAPTGPFCRYRLEETSCYSDGAGTLNGEQPVKLSWQPIDHALTGSQLLQKSKGQLHVVEFDGPTVNQMQLRTPSDQVRFLRDIHSKGSPSAVERQRLLINSKEYSLLESKSTLEHFECIKHAVIGWLIHFLNGSLHGDISIGNVLKMERADEKDHSNFTYPESFENDLKELDKRNATKAGEDAKLWDDMQNAKIEVEKLLKAELSPASSCTAFVADIDLGRPTNLLCEIDIKSWEEPSGTVQFMSRQVLWSIELGSNDFLQSPADDLESFFYVAVWAIFFNKHTSTKLSVKETILKSRLLVTDKRSDGMLGYLEAPPRTLSSPLTKEAQPLMKQWSRELVDFLKDIRERAMIDVPFAKDAADSLWRRSVGWILCALSGVIMIVRIINSHQEALQKLPVFVP